MVPLPPPLLLLLLLLLVVVVSIFLFSLFLLLLKTIILSSCHLDISFAMHNKKINQYFMFQYVVYAKCVTNVCCRCFFLPIYLKTVCTIFIRTSILYHISAFLDIVANSIVSLYIFYVLFRFRSKFLLCLLTVQWTVPFQRKKKKKKRNSKIIL